MSREHERQRASGALSPDNDPKISLISSQKDLDSLAHRIASIPSFREDALPALRDFLGEAYSKPGPLALAVVKRQEWYGRPTLEFFLLWSSPQDFSDAQEDKIEAIGDKHDHFAQSLSGAFDSSLHIIAPPQYATPEAFKAHLSTQCRATHLAQLIECVRLKV